MYSSLQGRPRQAKHEREATHQQKQEASARGFKSYLRGLWAEPEQQIASLRITICTGLLCGFGLSWRLWISSRLFPLSPVSDYLPSVPFPFDYIWLACLLGLLLTIIFTGRVRKVILIFLILAGLLSLWDQARWQPWFYLYFFLLAAVGLCADTEPDSTGQQATLNACRMILASTYFWSGLQKLNANFIRETWPDMAGPLLHLLPEAFRQLPAFIILMIPLLEISIGLGLLTRKYRQLAVALAVGTHIFVLVLLISGGENNVVWPWNIAMALFVVFLFWQNKETTAQNVLVPRSGFHLLALLLFAALPALSFVDLWDSYLSAALYSGNTDQAVIYVSPAVIDHLPAAIHPHIWRSSQPYFLDINRWSYGDLNVPLYPEPRIYRRVAERVCADSGDSSDVRLRIKEKPNPLTAARNSEYFDCDHLDSIH